MNKFSSISKPVENAALRVLSFGAGVQSTVLLLMAAKGEIKPMFDEAIRNVASNKVTQYVHSSAKPLRTADLGDDKTPDLFLGECDGMCGV